ncbi:MAG: DNA ligase [Stenotrophomonas sp.]
MVSRLLLCLLLLTCGPLHAASSPLMSASTWQDGPDVTRFWVSEKLDGVRARWDGRQLHTRTGSVIPAPVWFTRGWPVQVMDGELWIARGRFDATSAIVRSNPGRDDAWRQLRFMAFDLPMQPGTFSQRLAALQGVVEQSGNPHLALVEQRRLADTDSLHRHLRSVAAGGGEGLMLHHEDNPYRDGRSNGLFKLKLFEDAEARVIGYVPGKGKYTGMVGALLMEMPQGLHFRLGSGLSDALRRTPPPVGSQVTYRYNGLTPNGLPRFPRFLRVRHANQ